MSKKKRRPRKLRKRNRKIAKSGKRTCNKHHIFWMRKVWVKSEMSSLLRNHDYCIVMIPANTAHRRIHETVSFVPKPTEEQCSIALAALDELWCKNIISLDDSPEFRLTVLMTIFEPLNSHTTHALKVQRDLLAKG